MVEARNKHTAAAKLHKESSEAFDIAVEVTAESVEWIPSAVSKLLMSLVLAGIVIPNWTNHILPKKIKS